MKETDMATTEPVPAENACEEKAVSDKFESEDSEEDLCQKPVTSNAGAGRGKGKARGRGRGSGKPAKKVARTTGVAGLVTGGGKGGGGASSAHNSERSRSPRTSVGGKRLRASPRGKLIASAEKHLLSLHPLDYLKEKGRELFHSNRTALALQKDYPGTPILVELNEKITLCKDADALSISRLSEHSPEERKKKLHDLGRHLYLGDAASTWKLAVHSHCISDLGLPRGPACKDWIELMVPFVPGLLRSTLHW
eukprot:2217251-Amphidinium_carterae.1